MGVNDYDTFTGLTPLQQASLDGNTEKVVALIDEGADLNQQANGEYAGKTAAMIAAGGGHVSVLKAMQRGPSLLNLQAADGGTAAQSAAAHGQLDVLDFLIEKKVDLNMKDEDGWTALMFAVSVNNAIAVKKLLGAGAKADIKNNEGQTAVDLASSDKENKQIADILSGKEPLAPVAEVAA